jgi:hypothetical protein
MAGSFDKSQTTSHAESWYVFVRKLKYLVTQRTSIATKPGAQEHDVVVEFTVQTDGFPVMFLK